MLEQAIRVLVINGHPRRDSLSNALAESYAMGAVKAGAKISRLNLHELDFNPNVIHHSPNLQSFEPALVSAQQLISASDHLVLIFPTWWGTMPALLKGFLDRVFTNEFAFSEIEGGTGYAPLLKGKSAQLITTMDTPLWVYKYVYGSPGIKALSRATLGFCGYTMLPSMMFGPVKSSSASSRATWLKKVFNQAYKLRKGSIAPARRVLLTIGTWVKAVRLQFYPMTFIAYSMGAFASDFLGYGFALGRFWLGYSWLFFLELSTVLSNDYFDFETDKQNRFFGPFNGGSRVLVDQLLQPSQIKNGFLASLAVSILLLMSLLFNSVSGLFTIMIATSTLTIIALGYTIPPLRLSYRGLGETDVAVTHSFGVLLCGYLLQGGIISEPLPWLLSLPLCLAVFPSIILSGIPDRDADKAARKNTLAVIFNRKGACRLAILFTIISALSVIVFSFLKVSSGVFSFLPLFVGPHAMLIIWLLQHDIRDPSPPVRIDKLMVATLTYILWFGLIPLIELW